ncbi:prephenate dehydratase [Sinobaca qinghaiensis]|uniref:Prephenate dehydratase n=2 Tax=Sinobaca qinghaiensis TaxID=342944 RepID=A0A419V3W7_9BACL|nr:prephenate dehydratase [Sinobaca qinghaiensis]
MNKIGYLGPKGTFTEMAAVSIFAGEELVPFETIPACMDALAAEDIDRAVIPLENTIEGSVNMTLDYLIHKHNLPIIGEVTVPIEQHLMVHPSRAEQWREIEDVYSHPHAIAQCHDFLTDILPGASLHYTNSTSAAAEKLHDDPSMNAAAVANVLAAEQYGLTIVNENVHDYENNHTRFVVLAQEASMELQPAASRTGDKTTLMVTLPSDFSGALHQVLSAFAWRKLNLTKIESRPMKTGIGNYFFVIDVDQLMDDVLLPGAVAELEALGCGVRILGSYPCLFSVEEIESTEKKPIPK